MTVIIPGVSERLMLIQSRVESGLYLRAAEEEILLSPAALQTGRLKMFSSSLASLRGLRIESPAKTGPKSYEKPQSEHTA